MTIIGSGWYWPHRTALVQIELFFLAGNDTAIVQDLAINHRHVSSDNSLAIVRRCLFGSGFGDPFFDGYLAYVRGGLIIEECFINCQLSPEPGVYFYVQGGSFIMRNCVVAIQATFWMMDIHDLGPYPITLVDVHDNTFYAPGGMAFIINGNPPIPGPIGFVNNIFQAQPGSLAINDCSIGADVSIEYNVFSTDPQSPCGPPSSTNIIADPMLCSPDYEFVDLEDFEIHVDSPCVSAGLNGTTIGALEVGCGVTAVVGENTLPSVQDLRIDVSPNPLVRRARLMIGSEYSGATLLRLYDTSGRLEVNRLLHLSSGEATFDLDRELGTMSRAVHFLEVTQRDRRAVRKIVVVP